MMTIMAAAFAHGIPSIWRTAMMCDTIIVISFFGLLAYARRY